MKFNKILILTIVIVFFNTDVKSTSEEINYQYGKEFPSQSLFAAFHKRGLFRICGATLISSKCLITAAECLTNVVRGVIWIGRISIKLDSEPDGRSNHFLAHPKSSSELWSYNIGLIILEEPSPNFQFASLPNGGDLLPLGTSIIANGFNSFLQFRTDEYNLTFEHLNIIKNEGLCAETHAQWMVTNKTICAANIHNQNCKLDTGGPFYLNNETVHIVIGVINYVTDICPENRAALSISLFDLEINTWINKNKQ